MAFFIMAVATVATAVDTVVAAGPIAVIASKCPCPCCPHARCGKFAVIAKCEIRVNEGGFVTLVHKSECLRASGINQ